LHALFGASRLLAAVFRLHISENQKLVNCKFLKTRKIAQRTAAT
jgi:hypothetical protein